MGAGLDYDQLVKVGISLCELFYLLILLFISLNAGVQCPSINAPGNGSVIISSFYLSGVANYSCLPNYYLVGYSQRTCQQDGNWTGFQPICIHFEAGDGGSS